MGIRIKDDRRLYDDFVLRLYKAPGKKLDVGIQQEDADIEYESGKTMLQIAIWNEYGVQGKIPSRSFLRAWFDENENYVRGWMLTEFRRLARDEGPKTKTEALMNVGDKCVKAIKERILAGIEPENAHSSEKKKGFNLPLVEYGALVSHIKAKVK